MPVAAASEKSASVRRREPRAQQLTRAAVKLRHCRPALKSTWAALGALRQHLGSIRGALGQRSGNMPPLAAVGGTGCALGEPRRGTHEAARAHARPCRGHGAGHGRAGRRCRTRSAIRCRGHRAPPLWTLRTIADRWARSRPRGRRDEERLGQWAAPRALQCRDHAVETVAVARACAGEGIEEGDRARVLAPPVALGEREGIGVQFITIGYTGAQWPLRRDGSLGSPD